MRRDTRNALRSKWNNSSKTLLLPVRYFRCIFKSQYKWDLDIYPVLLIECFFILLFSLCIEFSSVKASLHYALFHLRF